MIVWVLFGIAATAGVVLGGMRLHLYRMERQERVRNRNRYDA